MLDKYSFFIDEMLLTKDKIDCKAFTIQLRKDGIMHYHVKAVEEFGIEDLHETMFAANELGEGKRYYNLVTFEDFITVSAEARKFAASEASNIYTVADAFVVKNTALKLVGNFYLTFNKPKVPSKLFSDEENALAWLYSLKK